jgi:hypothetical protein
MKILEVKLANEGTALRGIAISTRGWRYRWFLWGNGCLSVDREEEGLWSGVTHWRSLWGRLGVKFRSRSPRAAIAESLGAKQSATA